MGESGLFDCVINGTAVTFNLINFDLEPMAIKSAPIVTEVKSLETSAANGDIFAQYKLGNRLNTLRYFNKYLSDID